MLYGSVWTKISSFLKKEVYELGNYHVKVLDLVITGLVLIALAIGIIVVVHLIKKANRLERESRDENDEPTRAERRKQAKKEKKLAKKERKREEKKSKKIAKKAAYAESIDKKKEPLRTEKKAFVDKMPSIDPLTSLLGFDPYSAIVVDECEIVEEYYDAEQETGDMRALRERMKLSAQYEKKLAALKERLTKIRYEQGKTSRFIRDNRVVIESASAISVKLTTELVELQSDKKTAKTNKAEIDRINAQLQSSKRTSSELTAAVERRVALESKLNEAQSYVAAEIARAEHELSFVKKEIEQLNSVVGVEVKRLEDESHAREIMAKNRELRPLLISVNETYAEIKKIDADLEEIHAEKHTLREQIVSKKEDLKVSYGVGEAIQYSGIMAELNDRMIKLDETEESLIKRKEEKIEEYKLAKRKAHEFLDSSNYDVEDIVAAEDKVVGELEYERVKSEYETRKNEAVYKKIEAQKKYDTICLRKVKNNKRNADKYRVYTEELDAALAELKKAKATLDKVTTECEKVLPYMSPLSLVRSGSGVISRERLAKRREEEKKRERTSIMPEMAAEAEITGEIADDAYARQQPRRKQQTVDHEAKTQARPVNTQYARTKYRSDERTYARDERAIRRGSSANLPISQQSTAAQIRQLMARLNELERIALYEKEQRAMLRRETVRAADESNKLDRRKAQIVELRKQLNYISSENDVWKLKEQLYRISASLDEEEAADEVLNKMIQRLMNDATRMGEKLSNRGGGNGGNRRR